MTTHRFFPLSLLVSVLLTALLATLSAQANDFAAEYSDALAPSSNAQLRPGNRWKCTELTPGFDEDSSHGLMYGEVEGVLQDFPFKISKFEGELYSYYSVKNHEMIKEIRVDEAGDLLIRNNALDSVEESDFGTSPTNRIADRLMGYHPAPLVITGYAKCSPVEGVEIDEVTEL